MTLIVAFVLGRGVVVSADTRASGGVVYGEERKIEVVRVGVGGGVVEPAVVAGSGDAALVKQGFGVVGRAFEKWFGSNGRQPDGAGFVEIVGGVEAELVGRYKAVRDAGLDVDVNLLLASVTSGGEPVLYVFDSRGIAEPRHSSPGYALLGKGALTGGQLVLNLLGYSPSKDWDVGVLSAFLIDAVSSVDPSVSPFWDPYSSV
ncbi:MAG: hypothetical protein QW429_06720, partial [Thermoprotei archaeon]